jgi:hypothetical protein
VAVIVTYGSVNAAFAAMAATSTIPMTVVIFVILVTASLIFDFAWIGPR